MEVVVVAATVVEVVAGGATSGMWMIHPVRGWFVFAVAALRSLASCNASAVTPWAVAIDCHVSVASTW